MVDCEGAKVLPLSKRGCYDMDTEMNKEHEQEQKAALKYYKKHLKGKSIKDVSCFLSCLGGLYDLELFLSDDMKIEITSEGINIFDKEGKEVK